MPSSPSILIAGLAATLFAASGHVQAVGSPQSRPSSPRSSASAAASEQRALLDKYCVTCHNQRLKTADLVLDTLDVARVGEHAEIWEKVVRKLRGGVMPPIGRPRPDPVSYEGLTSWLETQLDRAAEAAPRNPGRTPVFHRMNPAEYHNAIRDLLALDIDEGSLLPADTSSYGFDNIGDVLTVSPLLLDRYLSASRKISQLAVGNPSIAPTVETFIVRSDLTQNDRIDGLPFGTRGGTLINHNFPLDGEYAFKIILRGRFNRDEPHQIEVTLDGERVQLLTMGKPDADKTGGGSDADEERADEGLQFRMPVKGGQRAVGVAFVKRSAAQFEAIVKPFLRAIVDQGQTEGHAYIGKVSIAGPYDATGAQDTPSRRRIFACNPTSAGEEAGCARTIISTLARRAYRRPVADADLQVLLGFYREGRAEGNFEKGIERALTRILMSPAFLFRIEPDPSNVAPNTAYRVSDLTLASRLSFFLWSSIPDDQLLDLAERGRLKDPAVLDREVRRMLADPRSEALVTNFGGQWLFLRNIPDVKPDDHIFPDFDENLRQAFRRETELFLGSILREDRNVVDLLNANYTFINERLARHYGIPNVYGDHFRRVTFSDDDPRGGLLGHGSILTLRSYANRTSPVLRGVWILDNLLGVAVPAPPANVPPLQETNAEGKVLSMRERMVMHRANPICASCHSLMDPLGLPLENFNAVGQWRTVSESQDAIDASGGLPNGTKFEGAVGLRKALSTQSDLFVTAMTEKLLTYGLGRGLEAYDAPAVRRIVAEAGKNNRRFSSIILGIVKSVPFQMRKTLGRPPAAAAKAAAGG